MADTYRHGVYTSEVPTSIIPMISAATPTVAFGTAPVHLATDPAPANTPVMCSTLAEFVTQFGWSTDFETYTLCEVAQVHFQLFGVAPVIFVNVLDTSKHVTEDTKTIENVSNPITLTDPIILSTLEVCKENRPMPVQKAVTVKPGTTTIDFPEEIANFDEYMVLFGSPPVISPFGFYSGRKLTNTEHYTVADGKFTLTAAGVAKCYPDGQTDDVTFIFSEAFDSYRRGDLVVDRDYTVAHDSNGNVVLTIIDPSQIEDYLLTLNYSKIDASVVTASDVIGGVDINTGKNTGMELVEEIYPRFGLIPGNLIAPKFSTSSTVAAILKAKATDINGVFQAMAIADISTADVTQYTGVNAAKNSNNLVDPYLVVTWPKVALGGTQYYLSTQVAALCGKVDSEHDDIPYKSPSNENIQADQCVLEDGTDLFLGKSQANYLNGQGVVTALNFIGGWKCWGNRTSAYPSNTDPKDAFIPIRRMFNWIANTLVTSFWSKIDDPMNRRLIETVVDSANIWLNGLTARGALVGGRVEVLEGENPTTDLLDGIIRFHVYIAPPAPAREIEFVMEYDPDYLARLFE